MCFFAMGPCMTQAVTSIKIRRMTASVPFTPGCPDTHFFCRDAEGAVLKTDAVTVLLKTFFHKGFAAGIMHINGEDDLIVRLMNSRAAQAAFPHTGQQRQINNKGSNRLRGHFIGESPLGKSVMCVGKIPVEVGGQRPDQNHQSRA